MTKRIAILGSTGSIGRQTLEVVDQNNEKLQIVALAAGSNWQELLAQVRRYRPQMVAMMDPEAAERLAGALRKEDIELTIRIGEIGLADVATHSHCDTVVTAVSGAIGLGPTMKAIEAGKDIALANKETLVAAGSIVMAAAKRKGVNILPVDSEHSAIFQCIQGQDYQGMRLILTASGGPFREMSLDQLERVTPKEALRHPNWRMGSKITIDSASLMNKGLEIIEAHWLFNVNFDRINVFIHPQSIIHSMVEFKDGSLMGQMGLPDMRLPIQYALSYPQRWKTPWPRISLNQMSNLTFYPPDTERFPCLELALIAGKTGGTLPAVMNAANEVAVHAFLDYNIGFQDIPRLVKVTMDAHAWISTPDFEEIQQADQWARKFASARITNLMGGLA